MSGHTIQGNLFEKNQIKNFTIYQQIDPSLNNNNSQKKSSSDANIKMPSDLKQWMVDVANKVSTVTGNNRFGVSTLGAQGLSFFRKFFSVSTKMNKEESFFKELINTIPDELDGQSRSIILATVKALSENLRKDEIS
jgi:hypothetical protein